MKKKSTLSLTAALCLSLAALFLLQALLVPKYMESSQEGTLIGEYYDQAGNHDVVFIGDSKYSAQLNNKIRFFNCVEYHVSGKPMTVGFIKGILAGNYDITEFYIDGLHRITGFSAIDLRDVFDEIEYLSTQENVNFTIALSTDVLPQYLNKYI